MNCWKLQILDYELVNIVILIQSYPGAVLQNKIKFGKQGSTVPSEIVLELGGSQPMINHNNWFAL